MLTLIEALPKFSEKTSHTFYRSQGVIILLIWSKWLGKNLVELAPILKLGQNFKNKLTIQKRLVKTLALIIKFLIKGFNHNFRKLIRETSAKI